MSTDSDHFRWHRKGPECIAQAALTNSKRPETFVKGVYPTHVSRGHGCWLWDHDGRKYLDFVTGLGTNIIGYANASVNQAIADQLEYGASLSLSTHHELEAAEMLKALFPFTDAWKFLKTGSEACSAAIRIARAATGRDIVLSEAYHGWHDDFVSLTPPALGIPSQAHYPRAIYPLNYEGCDWSGVAAVIIEPVVTDYSDERRRWLQDLRERCTKAGVLLIFDEVITGFRWPKFSVANYWGITPDLIVLGKAIANGMPLAAVGGKYAVMNGAEYFVSSTYAGETLSLVAAKKTMELLQGRFDMAWLWRQGQSFIDEFNSVCPTKVRLEGYPTRGILAGEPMAKALFMQEACQAGILFGPSYFINFPLASEAKEALGVIKLILGRIDRGEVTLRGEMPSSPFAQKAREKQQ